MDLQTAVSFLSSDNMSEQIQGAALIQHECYHNKDAKRLVRSGYMKLIP